MKKVINNIKRIEEGSHMHRSAVVWKEGPRAKLCQKPSICLRILLLLLEILDLQSFREFHLRDKEVGLDTSQEDEIQID